MQNEWIFSTTFVTQYYVKSKFWYSRSNILAKTKIIFLNSNRYWFEIRCPCFKYMEVNMKANNSRETGSLSMKTVKTKVCSFYHEHTYGAWPRAFSGLPGFCETGLWGLYIIYIWRHDGEVLCFYFFQKIFIIIL